ncbi:MAG TPA: Rid family hydrolase [Candidatus Dormibacteraeota bacterium]|nr:Rid family hydrolase [Candidatus Dormibacteraeota bacterium]
MKNVKFFTQKQDDVYAQAVRIDDRVEISGQGGWDDAFNFPSDLKDEIEQAFKNVENILEKMNSSWEQVIHVNSYHVGLAGHQDEMNETMGSLFKQYMPNHKPVWTNVGVTALGHPKMRVEIRVTAID